MRKALALMIVLSLVLVLAAMPALADRGGNGKGDDGRGVGRGRPTRTPTALVTATASPYPPTPTPRAPAPRRTPAARRFSAHGYFEKWVGATTLVLDDAWANHVADPAIDADGRLSVIVDEDTLYHAYGGGNGYETGLTSVGIPAGARVYVQGVARYPTTASGSQAEVPLLFADKVIVDLAVRSADDDNY